MKVIGQGKKLISRSINCLLQFIRDLRGPAGANDLPQPHLWPPPMQPAAHGPTALLKLRCGPPEFT